MQDRLNDIDFATILAEKILQQEKPLKLIQLLAVQAFNKTSNVAAIKELVAVLLHLKLKTPESREPYARGLYQILSNHEYHVVISELITHQATAAQKKNEVFMRSNSMLTALLVAECQASMYSKKKITNTLRRKSTLNQTFFEKELQPIFDDLIAAVSANYKAVTSEQWPEQLCEEFSSLLQKYLLVCFRNGTNNALPPFVYKNAFEIRQALVHITSPREESDETDFVKKNREMHRSILIKVGGYVILRYFSGLALTYINQVVKDQQQKEACLDCLTHVINIPIQNVSNQLTSSDDEAIDDKPQTLNVKYEIWEKYVESIMQHAPHQLLYKEYEVKKLLNEIDADHLSEDVFSRAAIEQTSGDTTWTDIIKNFLLDISKNPHVKLPQNKAETKKKNKLRNNLTKYQKLLTQLIAEAKAELIRKSKEDNDKIVVNHPLVDAIMAHDLQAVRECFLSLEEMNWEMTNINLRNLLSLAIKTLLELHKKDQTISVDEERQFLLKQGKEIFYIILYYLVQQPEKIYENEVDLTSLGIDLMEPKEIYIRRALEAAVLFQSLASINSFANIESACYLSQEFVTFFLSYAKNATEQARIQNEMASAFSESPLAGAEKVAQYFQTSRKGKEKQDQKSLTPRIKYRVEQNSNPPPLPPFFMSTENKFSGDQKEKGKEKEKEKEKEQEASIAQPSVSSLSIKREPPPLPKFTARNGEPITLFAQRLSDKEVIPPGVVAEKKKLFN